MGRTKRGMLEAERDWSSVGQFRSSQLTLVHRLEEQQCHGAGSSMACAFEIVSPLPGKKAKVDRAHEQSAHRPGPWNQKRSLWVSVRGCVARVLHGSVKLKVSLKRSEETGHDE